MGLERRVLLVSPSLLLVKGLGPDTRHAGYRVMVARTFESAKSQLYGATALLVTELKLGAYNGLHLALRCRASGIPAIVVADKTFEQEVEQAGAFWMSPESATSEELHTAITRLLQDAHTLQAYPWVAETSDENLPNLGLADLPTTTILH
jgi:DNA-binding response OmpR family regulator